MNNKVSVGITSIIGWLAALGGLLPTIIKALEEGQVALAGPEKYLAIAGIAFGLLTNTARYFQAHKAIPTIIQNTESDLPLIYSDMIKKMAKAVNKAQDDENEEIASDIDSVSTQVPSETPDGDNSNISPISTDSVVPQQHPATGTSGV